MARIITITSGKGGVGKTSISLNLSLSLASKGFKVCLFDADLGLANVNILTGIYPDKDLESVISGQLGLNDVIIKNYQGIDIIPGSSGVEKLANLTRTQTGTLINAFLDLNEYDYFIFDTSAGISSQVISFCMASHQIILVATCEPTSLTDAYSMLKVLSKYEYKRPVRIVINQVKSGKSAKRAYAKLKDTVKKFLSIKIEPLGIVASDKNVRAAVISQTPFFMLFPDTIASRCIKAITKKLIDKARHTVDLPLELFWDKCLSFLENYNRPEIDLIPEKGVTSTKAPAEENKEKDLNIKKELSQIESKLSTLIKDVGDIKQFLDTHEFIEKNRPEKKIVPPEPEEISLDFESWLNKKNKAF
ncbi:MAG: MinD/ParA family protein [Desulfobacteraceae bacterium]|nr:MinD/ParA family protein [Desulfobacteraceae bacterium]